MRDQYDFSKAKRGAVIPSAGKTRITIMLDDDVIEHFRAQAEAEGVGYQTLINALLRKALASSKKTKSEGKPLTVATLRRVLREELRQVPAALLSQHDVHRIRRKRERRIEVAALDRQFPRRHTVHVERGRTGQTRIVDRHPKLRRRHLPWCTPMRGDLEAGRGLA